MAEILTAFFVLAGTFFVFVAAFGVVRMPDLMMRMHAATKAGVMGCGLLVIALMIRFPETGIWARAIALVVFAILTSPVAAHMIGRAAHLSGVKLWEGTVVDEMFHHEKAVRREIRLRIEREERDQQTDQS